MKAGGTRKERIRDHVPGSIGTGAEAELVSACGGSGISGIGWTVGSDERTRIFGRETVDSAG